MVINININFHKNEYKWLDEKNESDAEEHIRKLIKLGEIVNNLTKNSINFDNDIFLPIKNEMNKISDENREKTNNINNEIIESMKDMKIYINKLVGGSNNASIKGKIGENLIEEIIKKNFPDDILINTSKKARESDYNFISNQETILIEIKTYTENVGTLQIEKFKNDMIRCGSKLGIFYSSTSGIVGIKNRIHLEKINNNQSILYVPNGGIENSSIVYCINFSKILLKNNNDNKSIIDVNLLQKYFDDFQNTYTDISKLSFEINKSKRNIDNIMGDLYKQSIDLELKSKYLIEDSKKKLEKIVIKEDLNKKKIHPNIINYLEVLRKNNDNRLMNLVKLIKLLEKYEVELDCENESIDKILIKIRSNEIISEIKICKTKMNIIFKNPQITILLEEESINYIELLLKDIINKN